MNIVDDHVCYGMNQCHVSYGGYRAWILVLRVVAPIVLLMIVIIVAACLQHKRDPTGQLQSRSIDHHSSPKTNANLSQENSQIFKIFMPQNLGIQV